MDTHYQKESQIYEKSLKGPVLYIRHGETWYNQAEKERSKDIVYADLTLLDSELSTTGRKQVEDLAPVVGKMKPRYIFTSPLKRCLETTYIALRTHPDRESIRIIVHPIISEGINAVHDYCRNIPTKKELYGENSEVKFDWSLFDKTYETKEQQDSYFINYMDSQSGDSEITKIVEKIAISCDDSLLEEMAIHHVKVGKRPESYKALFNRSQIFKNYLKELLAKNDMSEDEKILVFTHSLFTQVSTSKEAYNLKRMDEMPSDSYKPYNCEMITMKI